MFENGEKRCSQTFLEESATPKLIEAMYRGNVFCGIGDR
jgi:hypothetical protein